MKPIVLAFVAGLIALTPALGKNFAVPAKDPAITLAIPDKWKVEEIDYGFSASSPGEDVVVYVESADGAKIDKMLDLNTAWMSEQNIKPDGPATVIDVDAGPLKGKIFKYAAHDDNGATNVSFSLINGGKGRLIMITLWGSDEEQKAHDAEIDQILNSIKAID